MDYDYKEGGMIAMQRIQLDAYSPLHKTGHTSKGDQLKWKIDNIWYKADYMGYESFSEVLISHLLQKSTLLYPFVVYEPVQIKYNENFVRGCSSRDFLCKNQMLIPLEKLHRQYTGESLAIKLSAFTDISERIQYLVEKTEEITHINNFGPYITAMLEVDAFFLNEDRHTNNIAVIYDEETQQYSLSPLFDQGLCLFADIRQDYPINLSVEDCLKKIEAKPFSSDFDTQLEEAEALYGVQMYFHFTLRNIQEESHQLAQFYPVEFRRRVEQLLIAQMRKYAYLIKN